MTENALQVIQSKLKVPKSQYNKFGKYAYRNCEDILEAVKPLLKETKTTLIINDEIVLIGERYYIKSNAILFNNDGNTLGGSIAYARESESRKGMDDAQLTGATSSYARKYALNGLFAIDDTKDADTTNKHGNNGDEKTPEPIPETPEKPKKTGKFGFLETIGNLKKDLHDMTDNDEIYYKILGEFGFEHANEINDRDMQIRVYTTIGEKLDEIQRENK